MKREDDKRIWDIFEDLKAKPVSSDPTDMAFRDDGCVELRRTSEGRLENGHTLLIHEVEIFNVENRRQPKSEERYLEWDIVDETQG